MNTTHVNELKFCGYFISIFIKSCEKGLITKEHIEMHAYAFNFAFK